MQVCHVCKRVCVFPNVDSCVFKYLSLTVCFQTLVACVCVCVCVCVCFCLCLVYLYFSTCVFICDCMFFCRCPSEFVCVYVCVWALV